MNGTCQASVVHSGCPAPVADGRYLALVVDGTCLDSMVDGRFSAPAPVVDVHLLRKMVDVQH